jgi:tetratricopeptide (TPR) repeat protein
MWQLKKPQPMNSKAKLKTFFDSKRDFAEYVEMYDENKDFFNDLLKEGRKEEIEFVIPIKMYKYADSLIYTGNYRKALAVLSEIDKDLEKIKGQSKLYKQYLEGVTFLKGVSLGRLKKYRESNIEFEKALRNNPTNDKFINWYKSNKKEYISKILNSIAIIGVFYYVIIIIFDLSGHHIKITFIRLIGIAVALLSYGLSYVWKQIIDKTELKFKK